MPEERLTIVWSCVGIMLICTWSVLHPNVPFRTIPRSRKQRYIRAVSRLHKKIWWMLLNVLAPEWSLGKAWADYQAVRAVEADFNTLKDEKHDNLQWTRDTRILPTWVASRSCSTIRECRRLSPVKYPLLRRSGNKKMPWIRMGASGWLQESLEEPWATSHNAGMGSRPE